MQPKVSIIIPVYNRASIIEYTLDSVLNQTYANWECIVVDDGSTDNTLTTLHNYSKKDKRIYSFNRPNYKLKGPSSCRNFGLEKASGDYVVFLDSDDLLATYCLESRVRAFEKYFDCDFLVFKMERFVLKPNKHFDLDLKKMNLENCLESFLELKSIWQVTSPIYKKKFVDKSKYFNEELLNYEDLELAVRVLIDKPKYLVFSNVDCFYRNDKNYKLKYLTKEVQLKSVKGFIAFIKSVDESLIDVTRNVYNKRNYKQSVVKAYKKVFIVNIKDNIETFKDDNKWIINFFNHKKYFTNNDKIKCYFVHFVLFKFYKLKGIGLYRLIKTIYK